MRQGDGPEAGEAGERLLLLGGGGPLFLLDGLEGADGGEDVAGFGLSRRWRCGRRAEAGCWLFHGGES